MEGLDATEKRKIADMIKKGKDGESMDWMYSENKTNTDDYLLGKKIDKHFEKSNQTPPKEDDIFGERIKANIALDMQAKMREDPLYAIKKREEESRRKILNNPVKMKELQKMIAQQKKEKKKNMKKKYKHRHRDFKDDDDDDDDDLVQQYLSILTQKHGQDNRHHIKTERKEIRYSSSESDDSQHRKTRKALGKHTQPAHDVNKHKNSSKTMKKEFHHSSDSTYSQSALRGKRMISHSPVDSRQSRYGLITSSRHQSRSRSPKFAKKKKRLSPHHKMPECRSPSPSYRRSQHYRCSSRSPHMRKASPTQAKRKVSDMERKSRLQEMMDNAKWREDQQRTNVHHYQEEDHKEQQQTMKKGSCADFLNPLMSQHATNSTVEDRLRRNKYNIQRTKAALEKDFTKH